MATTLAACGGAAVKKVVVRRPDPVVIAVGGVDPKLVTFSATPSSRLTQATQAAELFVRLRIDAGKLARQARPRVNLALVVDTSGSMEGDPIDAARSASLAVVDQLADGDSLAVIAFHSKVDVLLPLTVINRASRDAARLRIGRMTATGTTDLAAGLSAGLGELSRVTDPNALSRIVLVGDGVPNDASQIPALADAAAQRQIRITSLGLGIDYDETLMADVARRSGGRFHYVSDPKEVASVFEGEILELKSLVARAMAVNLRPGPGVTIHEVIGHAPARVGTAGWQVALGDLSEGERQDVVVRLSAPGRKGDATIELLDATLSFDDAIVNAGRLERDAFTSVRASTDAAAIEKSRELDVMKLVVRVRAAAWEIEAIALARQGFLPQALALVQHAAVELKKLAAWTGDDELIAMGKDFPALAEKLPGLARVAMLKAGSAPGSVPEAASAEDAEYIREKHSQAVETTQPAPRND